MSDVPPQEGPGLTQEDIDLLGQLGISPDQLLAVDEQPGFLGIPDGLATDDGTGRFTIPAPVSATGPGSGVQRIDPTKPWGPDNIVGSREVRFTEADVFGPLTRSGAELVELQDQLVAAGLLAKGSYVPGVWDGESQDAMRQLLGYANLSGRDPDALMTQLSGLREQERQKLRSEAMRRATASFVKTDPATTRTAVKSAVRNLIRRDPTDQEMAEITAHWRQFEQEDLGQMRQQAAGQAEFEAGFIDDLPVVTDVDPEARLEEFLAQRFAGTITQNRRVEEMQNGQHNILNAVDRLARTISG